MTICTQASDTAASYIGCFIYDFQTLLTGLAAIGVAVLAGIPVWRQLKDSNLQTRISHRETLATMLRDALRRYARVDKALSEPMAIANRVTSDPIGEPTAIDAEDAHHLEHHFLGVLDWYLVILADTEHAEIEQRKQTLKTALGTLTETLSEAHWADHNEQHDEDHQIPDEEWATIIGRCAQAKIEASAHVGDVAKAYRELNEAQQRWVRSLRTKIARLDIQIAGST